MDKGEGGFSHCGHFADMGGGGVNFLQFCADVFYEQPLIDAVELIVKKYLLLWWSLYVLEVTFYNLI